MRHFFEATAKVILPVWLFVSPVGVLSARGPDSFALDAQAEFLDGNYESAKEKFEILLDEPSKNAMAKDFLGRIAAAEAASKAKAIAQLRTLKLPLVEFRETSLDSALEYLRQQIIKASNGELNPTFVVQPGVDRSAVVTIRLKDIPVSDVLRYLNQLMLVRFTIDQQTISVSPRAVQED